MKLKLFQKQDLARAALKDGLILSWDTGLGKTWALYLWPLLKVGFERVAPARDHPGLAVHVVADAERILRQDDFGLDVGTEAGWPVERHGYRHRASADSRLARAASIQSAVRRKIGCRR